MEQHPDRPKLINLLIDFEQKLESSINKKYRPFLKSLLNLQTLSAGIDRDKPIVTKQLIAFKLGLQSKVTKCIEISLVFLNRLFQGKFINLNLPDYTECFIIGENQVKQHPGEPTRKIKNMLVRTLEELVHFKNSNIDNLLIKSFQHLIGQNVLTPILQLSERPPQNYFNVLCSYFSFRFYFFQQCYVYTQHQANYINQYAPKIQRLYEQIKKAQIRHNHFQDLVGMYLDEIVYKITGEGGRYGMCIICRKPCDKFCKDTKASVCSTECKQKHLKICERVDGDQSRSKQLYQSIISSLNQLFQFIKNQPKNLLMFIQLVDIILAKPYLFMIVKSEVSNIFYRELPFIIGTLYPYTNPKCQKLLFDIMASLTNLYKHLFLSDIQQFFVRKILFELESKKPKLQTILNINRFLGNIFKNGQNFVELYANLDTSLNRQNVIQRLMYELARILQDRFSNFDLTKADKIALKSECLQIHSKLVKSLLEIPFVIRCLVDIQSIISQKNRKTNLQKFLIKFNESWNAGIKSLFNLNIITLDNSQEEILNILTTVKNIKKSSIEQYLKQSSNANILKKYIQRINEHSKSLLQSLLEYYLILPLPENIVYQQDNKDLLHSFVSQYQRLNNKDNVWDQVVRWLQLFKQSNNLTIDKFKEVHEYQQLHFDERKLFEIYIKIFGLQNPYTQSYQMRVFHFCNNPKYLDLIQGQLSLLQICISHLLESHYQTPRTLSLIRLLQQLCPNTPNLFTLVIKNTNMEFVFTSELSNQNILLIAYLIDVPQIIPDCIFDWTPILRFYNEVFYFTLGACLTTVTLDNKNKLLNSNISNISVNILKISSKISLSNFAKFVNSLFRLSITEADYERTFLLEKAFSIVNNEVNSFVKQWKSIFPNIVAITLKPVHYQISLFSIHSVKENFVLAKKNQLTSEQQTQYFQLFKQFYTQFQKPQLRVALLQSLCYSVQNCQQLGNNSWKIIFSLSLSFVKDSEQYHDMVYRIVQKIMKSNLLLFLDFYQDIFVLLTQMCNMSSRRSTQVFIDLKVLLQFLFNNCHRKVQGEQDKLNKQRCFQILRTLLSQTLTWLVGKFDSESFDTCIQVFFSLIKIHIIQIYPIHFQNQEKKQQSLKTNDFINMAFDKIVERTSQKPFFFKNAESFINEAVSTGSRIKYYYILNCLSRLVRQNFDELSFIAIAGIKKFLQESNPQKFQDWKVFSQVLVEIIDSSRTKNIKGIQEIKQKVAHLKIFQLINESKHLPDIQPLENIQKIMNKLIIQQAAIKDLPNDTQCIPVLLDIYKQLKIVNDNLCLRMCLWKAGFGKGSVDVPSLLKLQQTVIERILSIYIFNGPLKKQFFQFASETFLRYSSISQDLLDIQPMIQSSNTNKYQYEMLVLLENDLKKKKHLSEKFVRFFLPKLIQQQMTKQVKILLGKSLIVLMGYYDAKTVLLKLLRKLKDV